MSDPTNLTVPDAGWYADRNDANTVRWWDGSQWTEHTHSIAPEQNVAQPVSAAAFGFTPVEPNPVAAASVPAAAPSAAVAAAGQAAPGWYPDHADRSIQRWWDGTQWTTHTAPGVAIPNPTPGSYLGAYAAPIAPTASSNNTMATLSLIFGLVSLVGAVFIWLFALSIAAIIVGAVALRRASRYPQNAARRGQAIAGIVIGAVSVVLVAFLAVVGVIAYEHVHSGATSQNATQSGSRSFLPSTVAELKQDLARSFVSEFEADYPVAVSHIDCDPGASMVPGATFTCRVVVDDGRQAEADINVNNAPAAAPGQGMGWGASWGKLALPAGSSEPLTLDMIEQDISYTSHYENNAPVSAVDCPKASLAAGAVFQCSITFVDGRVGLDQVSMTNDHAYRLEILAQPTDVGSSSDPDLAHT